MTDDPVLPLEPPDTTLGDRSQRAAILDDRSKSVPQDSEIDFLRHVITGDPLEVRSQVVRRLRERCLLMDPQAVAIQVFATLAAERWNGSGELEPSGSSQRDSALRPFVEITVDRVIDDCVAGRQALPTEGFARGGILMQLARVLKIRPGDLNKACDRFNRLPADARRAFHALVLQRRSLESACRRSASAAESWSSGAIRALKTVLDGHGESGSIPAHPGVNRANQSPACVPYETGGR